jgi:two-component system, cell cycle response regulator DivK
MAGEKILIVEDNRMNMELAVDLLELAGFNVVQAETAEKGIALANAELPDIILMDIALPGMDGLTAARIIKADDLTKEIPVIALTAHAMRGDEDRAMAAGCDGYLTKPVNTRTFSGAVGDFIQFRNFHP